MKLFTATIFLLFLSQLVEGQTQYGKITGTVVMANGKAADGAQVILKNTSWGVTTASDGSFQLPAPAGSYVLVVSMVGKTKREIPTSIEEKQITHIDNLTLDDHPLSLAELVVTGQFEAQSLKNSVYQVRTIDSERIRLRGATNIQSVLNTELGMRFTLDPAMGTSNIELMGMSGQNVKILLDGIPMVDRGGVRESLGQIDINTIERIEIVEGPMSVIYGTDALAGVINLISKKINSENKIAVSARVQEETVGSEYTPFTKTGTHNQHMGITWQRRGLQVSGNVTRNHFGGWQGDSTGRIKAWLPKEQWLYAASIGYNKEKWKVFYRFNETDETIKYLGEINQNKAGDVDYISKRWFHQMQGEYKVNDRLHLTGALSYTDYSRRTLSTTIDFTTGRRTLALGASQDKSMFSTTFFRGTARYKLSSKIDLQTGVDISNNNSSGERILGSPTINEYALFLAPEIKLTPGIKINPGLRFLKNSVYDAPPVIPSLNGKIALGPKVDLRFGYARGFRSPALRELYFKFKDASHDIIGNPDLKAEYSNSFNGSLAFLIKEKPDVRVTTTLGGFYNVFHDQIKTAESATNASIWTYFNLSLYKTTGLTLENKIHLKNFQATLGGSYIGRYNELTESTEALGSSPEFTWSPELNSHFIYAFPKIGASVNLFYKFSGKLPAYKTLTAPNGSTSLYLAETAGFHTADLTLSKSIGKNLNLMAGSKNLFNVTNLRSTAQSTGVHDPSNSVIAYGRSYFLGIQFQWSKN